MFVRRGDSKAIQRSPGLKFGGGDANLVGSESTQAGRIGTVGVGDVAVVEEVFAVDIRRR